MKKAAATPEPWKPPPEPPLKPGSALGRKPVYDQFGFQERRRDPVPVRDDRALSAFLTGADPYGGMMGAQPKRPDEDTQAFRDHGGIGRFDANPDAPTKLPVKNLHGRR